MDLISSILLDGADVNKPDLRDYFEALETRRAGDYLGQYAASIYYGTATGIECFGDSTMWGATVGDLTTKSAFNSPAILQSTLRTYFGNTAPTVTNSAISGTRVAQMLAGTDGSGLTFAARIAASSAAIIYCNHCINSCANGDDIIQYKKDMKTVSDIVRQAGKVLVLCTPNPMLPYGIAEAFKAELLKGYVELVRMVAQEENVALVDNYLWAQKAMAGGLYSALQVVGDGVHPTDTFYAQFGRNFAIPLLRPAGWLSRSDQHLYCSEDCVLASGVTLASAAPNSKASLSKITPAVGAQSIRFPVVVDENDLDLYIAHPTWNAGSQTVTLKLDANTLASNFSMYADDYGGVFLQDYETKIKSQICPGLHMVEINVALGSAGLYYARVRPTLVAPPVKYRNTPTLKYRHLWLEDFEFVYTGTGDVALLTEFPTSHFLDPLTIEFTAQLNKGTGIVLCGGMAADNAASHEAKGNIIIAANVGSGFLAIFEGGGVTFDVPGVVDLSLASHDYKIVLSSGRYGAVYVYVDGVLVDNGYGVTYALTRAYWGGSLGFWAIGSGTLSIDRLFYTQ